MPTNAEMSPPTASADWSTDVRGTGGRARRRRPLRKSLALAAAAIIAVLGATAVVTGVTPHSPASAASAATRNWVATSGTIYGVRSADPATAAHFYNTAGSYDVGGNPAATPVPGGWTTTPALNYTSYAAFADDLSAGRITYPYKWVLYDPENWAQTPIAEKQDPVKYMRLFAALAHAKGLQVILAPSLDLAWVAGSVYPRQAGETGTQWYVRVIAGPAGAAGDLLVVQNESQTTNISQYQYMYNNARSKARAAHPDVIVDSEVSTVNGTASQMATAARSVSPDGYYVASAGDMATTTQFLNLMESAGY